MKKNRILAVFAIVIAVLLLISGCTAALQSLENKEVRQITETMLDAIIANDSQTAYSLVQHFCTESDFTSAFAQMQDLLGETTTYGLKLLYIQAHTSIDNGERTNSFNCIYELTDAAERLVIQVQTNDQYQLRTFYLTPYEYTDYHFTGTLKTMQDATLTQWSILLLNIIPYGLMVFALVDCCRNKIKKKILWVLLLIFGVITFSVTMSSSGMRLNFSLLSVTAYSALIRYGSGTVVCRLMLPVGAIVYLAIRRSLLEKGKDPVDIQLEEIAPRQDDETLPLQDEDNPIQAPADEQE